MARKKRRSILKRRHQTLPLHPELKQGIYGIVLFALAILIFLSFFQIAGTFGAWISFALSSFFGLDRYLVPIVLIIIGSALVYPQRLRLSFWNYVGFLLFFLSFNGLMNLFLINRPEPFTADLTLAGGYLGTFSAQIGQTFLGYWGTITTAAALLLVSVLLMFNTSVRSLTDTYTHLLEWLSIRLRRDHEPIPMDEDESEDDEIFAVTSVTPSSEPMREEKVEETSLFEAKPFTTPIRKEFAVISHDHRTITIPLHLLHRSNSKAQSGDIERHKEIIEKTFREFGIDVEMGRTSVGPTVTQYTLRPAQGVKLSRVVSLQNDLALALAAHPLRMEAPVPGQSLVGIEVPNHKVATVTLRDVMETEPFQESARLSPLTVALGKDVSGTCYTIALDRMPHLLVAGATGAGKSVCLNTMIVSWLYQNGPDDLKLILVDPKRVELTAYHGIPHLLVPPIVSVDDTVNALKWTVREMERRLDLLSKVGARHIDGYNEKSPERMPRIVIVIDELADLMSASGREVEVAIVRIAQMARAVGIHLVLATQRPSVDVITGLIKANIPGRIAFAVASQTDSRTILDQSGAEKLLGRGDMLFTSADVAKPKRLQGTYISTNEVEAVVKHLKGKGNPDYNMAVTEVTKAGTVFDAPEETDVMLEEAIRVVLESGKASTSFLQRRLRLGYARAARIIDMMEEVGVVGPGSGAKPREILVDSWPPGGNVKQAMPTAQDDYDEAGYEDEREKQEKPETENGWENEIDERWIESPSQEEVR